MNRICDNMCFLRLCLFKFKYDNINGNEEGIKENVICFSTLNKNMGQTKKVSKKLYKIQLFLRKKLLKSFISLYRVLFENI